MVKVGRVPFLCSTALALAACGGGSGGGETNFIPSPPVTPTPTPVPPVPPVPPIPAGPIGLQSAAPFQVYSAYRDSSGAPVSTAAGFDISYSAADNRYTVTVPANGSGQLVTTGGEGSFNDAGWLNLAATANSVIAASGSAVPNLTVVLGWPASSEFNYTSSGRWYDPRAVQYGAAGYFVYGIPTAAGDVPVSGNATYSGSVSGVTGAVGDVYGSVSLNFDFGAGTLAGVMKPEIAPIWDAIPLGNYTFRDTVYSRGSTSFSGAFNVPGSTAPSSFRGSFNGPQATELMAQWTAPYLDPTTNQWGTMSGVWKAKKP